MQVTNKYDKQRKRIVYKITHTPKENNILIHPHKKNNIIKCPKPECQSLDIWKYGFEYYNGEKKQRYKCKKCGHVWIEK